jgi:TPR repeat protein
VRYAWALIVIGCASEPAAPAPVERSPDEQAEIEPPSAIEASGGFVAAMHAEASRKRREQPAQAAALFDRACEHGHTPSCIALADMLERGEGIPADLARAESLWDRACFEGSTEACDHLGH